MSPEEWAGLRYEIQRRIARQKSRSTDQKQFKNAEKATAVVGGASTVGGFGWTYWSGDAIGLLIGVPGFGALIVSAAFVQPRKTRAKKRELQRTQQRQEEAWRTRRQLERLIRSRKNAKRD